MTTRNYAPRDNNEGEIGVQNKWWAKSHIVAMYATNVEADSINATNVEADSINATSVEAASLIINGAEIISNYIKRNKSYIIGDITYQSELSSWVRLECVEAGTTASTLPEDLNSAQIGEYIIDGTVKWIICDIRDGLCVGDIAHRPTLKKGYVKLNGATVQRADYPRLVQYATNNRLWTDSPSTELWKFGNGDGETTFVLPDYRNIFIEGGDTPSKINAGLPNINGAFLTVNIGSAGIGVTSASGCFVAINSMPNVGRFTLADITQTSGIDFNANRSNAIYGASGTVQPPAIKLIPQIKY